MSAGNLQAMRIAEIRVYQVDLPLAEGRYAFADGKFVETLDSTLVEVVAGDGRIGLGESCPLGPAYLPAFAAGVRAAIGEIAPALMGMDPTESGVINRAMDRALMGHPFAKSPLDIACWDLAGQASGMPLCAMLGGRFGESVELYRAISQESPEEMAEKIRGYRAQGYRKFQLKVGGAPTEDVMRVRAIADELTAGELLVADANGGWSPPDAARAVNAVAGLDVWIEQPCASYAESLSIRRRTPLPFVLDESIDGVPALLRAHADGAMDAVNLKIGKVGGLTRARQIRDLCVSLGYPMQVEDAWGSDVATAAIAHLAHSTPERMRYASTDFNSYVTVGTANGAPNRNNGKMKASDSPGLGAVLNRDAAGKPVAIFK